MNFYDINMAKKLSGGGGITPSGTLDISENGTFNVTAFASASVAVPFVTYRTGTTDPASSLGNDGDIYLKVVS